MRIAYSVNPAPNPAAVAPKGAEPVLLSVAKRITSIANLPEPALAKLSGAPRQLGCGFSGYISRECADMPPTDRFVLATKFVAVKQHYATLLKRQSEAALLMLGNRDTRGAKNVLSATPTAASFGHVGTPLAHMDLDTFIRTYEIKCVDALVMTRDLSRGLAALHAAGLVHGDVQTKSMLVGPGGYLVGEIDGRLEGEERDLRPGNYSRSSDVADLHFVLSEIFKNAVPATEAGRLDERHDTCSPSNRPPENTGDLPAQIGAELAKRGSDTKRAGQAVASFAESLAQLEHGAHDEAALEGLASKADALIGMLQAAPPPL